jgi:hypothetical protein
MSLNELNDLKMDMMIMMKMMINFSKCQHNCNAYEMVI